LAVHYEVRPGETLAIRGPANVTVKGGEVPLIGDPGSVEAPTLEAIDPDTAEAGGPDFMLTATGAGFKAASTIVIGVVDVVTSFVDEGTLTANIVASSFVPGEMQVKVRTGPQVSEPVTLTFADQADVETLLAKKRRKNEAGEEQKTEKRRQKTD